MRLNKKMKSTKQTKQNKLLCRFTVNLSAELSEHIHEKCNNNLMSVSQYIRQLIIDHETKHDKLKSKHKFCEKYHGE